MPESIERFKWGKRVGVWKFGCRLTVWFVEENSLARNQQGVFFFLFAQKEKRKKKRRADFLWLDSSRTAAAGLAHTIESKLDETYRVVPGVCGVDVRGRSIGMIFLLYPVLQFLNC